MFCGMEWYWWVGIAAAVAVLVPLKVKFMKWWARRQKERRENRRGKWGDEE